METQLKKKSSKSGRYRYFQLYIHSGISGARLKLLMGTKNFLKILTIVQFVSQEVLEKTFSGLQIEKKGRSIKLKRFAGQLECDLISGSVYWNISLETKSLTTSPCLGRVISEKLFQTEASVDPRIKILSKISFESLNKKTRFKIPKSCWYPGYFNDRTVNLASLLQEDEIQQSIQDNPNKYRGLLESLENLSK